MFGHTLREAMASGVPVVASAGAVSLDLTWWNQAAPECSYRPETARHSISRSRAVLHVWSQELH
jgi:hypothetical protein